MSWVLLADRVDGGAIAVGEDRDDGILVGAEALAGSVDDVDIGGGDDGGGDGRGGVVDWWWGLLVLLGRAVVEGGLVLRRLGEVLGQRLRRVAAGVAGREVGGQRGIVAAGLAAGELLRRVALDRVLLLRRRVVLRRVLLELLRRVLLGIRLLRGVSAALRWLLRRVAGGWRLGPEAARCGVAARRRRVLVGEVAVLWIRH